jgi:hypothetical protein
VESIEVTESHDNISLLQGCCLFVVRRFVTLKLKSALGKNIRENDK